MRGRRLAPAALAVLAGVALLGAAPAGGARKPQRKTVKVFDNYYQPTKLTVNRGSTIRWLWPEDVGDVHDVKLDKAPRGVRKFQSDAATIGYDFKRKLPKPGKYFIVCTLHDEMTMTITVRR